MGVRLKNFCCCDLRAGAAVIGWLGLISAILNLFGSFNDTSEIVTSRREDESIETYMKTAKSTMIGNSIVEILVNSALLYGVKNSKKMMLLPWLISRMISLVILTIALLVIAVLAMIYLEKHGPIVGGIVLGIGLAICGFLAYCWVCILCLYKDYAEEEQMNDRRRHEEIGFIVHRPQMMPGDVNPPPYNNV